MRLLFLYENTNIKSKIESNFITEVIQIMNLNLNDSKIIAMARKYYINKTGN